MDPIIAWRVWDMYPDDGLLRSVFQADVWPPGERFEARCQRQGVFILAGRECPDSPRRACTCGIYATHSESDLNRFHRYTKMYGTDRRSAFEVFGKISMWGKIVPHDHGFRAQYAYPYEVWVRPPAHHEADADAVMGHCLGAAHRIRTQYGIDAGVMR